MFGYQKIKIDLNQTGILRIILNCPKKLNVLNMEVLGELENVFINEINQNVKAILLLGEGRAFCAGVDINDLEDLDSINGTNFSKRGQKVFNLLESLLIPTLAAVQGFAYGGGCELALAANLRIATKEAQFSLPEIKLGLIPGFGGTQRLPQLIGKSRAMEMCLTGKPVAAIDALYMGLINEIVEAERLWIRGEEILTSILSQAPLAIRSILEVFNQSYNQKNNQGMFYEATQFGALCATDDKNEGVKAFLEKRNPLFRRR